MRTCEICQEALTPEERKQYSQLQTRINTFATEHNDLEARLREIKAEAAVVRKEMLDLFLGAVDRKGEGARQALLDNHLKKAAENIP